jgi:putative ABC transport system permease protein
MNAGETLRTVGAEIRGHKLRSALTLLGIILGTLSITVMTSLLDGVVAAVLDGFDDLGYDGVVYVVDRDARDLREQMVFARSRGLGPEDAGVLLARGELVAEVAPAMVRDEIVGRGSVERVARVMGVTPGYATVRNRRAAQGRFIDDLDDRSFAKVCVLGHRLKRRLFGTEDALGKTVRIGSRPFRVVGVGERLGNRMFDDDDMAQEMEGVFVPLGTLRKFYSGDQEPLAFLAVKTRDVERLGDSVAEVKASLRLAHRGAEDFRVENIAEEILRARKEVRDVIFSWRVVLGSIAGISLVVGGIGLLSVMLISIGERVYEIGLRKALGATGGAIFVQFLVESVVLALVGGVIGAGLGVAIIRATAQFFPEGLPVRVGGVAVAIAIAALVGAIYGIYPALKASRMEPVEALRTAG